MAIFILGIGIISIAALFPAGIAQQRRSLDDVTGPVVAGIIGTRKFSYDLWGDAVNTASRMESSGVAGEVQITAATQQIVAASFTCTPRGTIEVKGKGPMPVWTLEGRRP